MALEYYKKNQGVIVRTATAISVLLMVLYGFHSLYRTIPPVDTSVIPPRGTFWGTNLLTIPFFDFSINYGVVISIVLSALASFLIYILVLNKPKTSDYLIDTESELKKVSWPSRPQYLGSSVAVIVSMVILGLFLIAADQIFSFIIHNVIKLY
jgi:preprotein translocase SecE subunit